MATALPRMKISITERQMFKHCRRHWDLGARTRRNLEPNKPDVKSWFGIGIHEALAAYYSPEPADPVSYWDNWVHEQFARFASDGVATLDAEWELLYEQRDLGHQMLEHYLTWAPTVDDFLPVVTEFDFEVPIREPETGHEVGVLVGHIDGVVQDSSGDVWILEHKTSATSWSLVDMLFNDQTLGYMWVVQQLLGSAPRGVIFNILRKKVPRVPQLLKNGGLSRAKNIDTTFETYMRAIEDNGLDPVDYVEILRELKDRGNTFFQREKVYRTPQEVANWGRDLYFEYRDMASDPVLYPNFTSDCKWRCAYRSLCQAMQKGEDWELLAQLQYHERDLDGDTYVQIDDSEPLFNV